MPSLTAPPTRSDQEPRPTRGRWKWTLSGVVTVVLLAVFGGWALVRVGDTPGPSSLGAIPTRTVTVSQPVTSVSVTSYGAPIRLARGPVSQVTVVEGVTFDKGPPPVVTERVSNGTLTLAAPSCVTTGCSVRFLVTVPTSVAVNAASEGGEISVAGATTANLESGGGPVTASGTAGALTVTSEGGSITATGADSADLDSGGGPVVATAVRGTVTANADGGSITVARATGADLDTGGGPAVVTLPGGPYAVTADSFGGLEQVTVPASPTAPRTVSVTTDGGELRITPPGTGT